jgi:hypothetical protein
MFVHFKKWWQKFSDAVEAPLRICWDVAHITVGIYISFHIEGLVSSTIAGHKFVNVE